MNHFNNYKKAVIAHREARHYFDLCQRRLKYMQEEVDSARKATHAAIGEMARCRLKLNEAIEMGLEDVDYLAPSRAASDEKVATQEMIDRMSSGWVNASSSSSDYVPNGQGGMQYREDAVEEPES